MFSPCFTVTRVSENGGKASVVSLVHAAVSLDCYLLNAQWFVGNL